MPVLEKIRFARKIRLVENRLKVATNSFSSFSGLPNNCALVKYVEALWSKCNLSRLANKIVRWFSDTKGSGKEFDYRFTGRDSRFFLYNFMYLIDLLDSDSQGLEKNYCHVQAFICLCLRDIVSYFSRLEISDEEVGKLKALCLDYFRANCLYQAKVNPTVWTIGHVVPAHTLDMKKKYGLGLGLNSMEGREAKHIAIAKYSTNTNYHKRWEQIFLHEFVSLIWLRGRGYNLDYEKTSCSSSYIPKHCTNSDLFCYCGFVKNSTEGICRFCRHNKRQQTQAEVKAGKLTSTR